MKPLPELAPNEVYSRLRTEEINGEHKLEVITTRSLMEGWRALTIDAMGKWREWVVTEVDENHQSGRSAIGTYHLVWSLQYDLTYTHYHDYAEVGMEFDGSSQDACDFVLLGQSKWERGTCDASPVEAGKGCFSVYESSWERLSKVVEAFACEVDATIEVSDLYGVTARKLDLRAHVGSTATTRRFDWGRDVNSIRRTPDPGPYYCRVVPLGKGDTEYAGDDETSFEWPIDITEETGGIEYIEDTEAAVAFRVDDGDGGYYYPTKTVTYNTDDPEELLWMAQDDLPNHTRPNVTYEADVVQFEKAGLDSHGVALGDDVQIVDRGFNPDAPLRLQGRVIAHSVYEPPTGNGATLTIGQVRRSATGLLGEMTRAIEGNTHSLGSLNSETTNINTTLASMGTQAYVDDLLRRINVEIAADGGYAYLVPGEGMITYDNAVADPVIGDEAESVVQVKGGAIRLADTKNSGFQGIDDWNWRTLIQSGHIASDLVTAAKITSGFIGNPNGNVYLDLDEGKLYIGPNLKAIDETLSDIGGEIDDARKVAENYLEYDQGTGALSIGDLASRFKQVLTNTGNYFQDSGEDVAYLKLDDDEDIWKFFINVAQITNMLRFGDFAWIARDNGNMTLKWIGDSG